MLESLATLVVCVAVPYLAMRFVTSPFDTPALVLFGGVASWYGYAWCAAAWFVVGGMVSYPLDVVARRMVLEQRSEVRFLLTDGATAPLRATSGSAGYDLYSAEQQVTLRPGERRVVRTGVSLRGMNANTVAFIKSRSSAACKGVDACAGVIDSDYEGPIGVVLHNTSANTVTYTRGDRVAQLCFLRLANASVCGVQESDAVRGAGGFGSTG